MTEEEEETPFFDENSVTRYFFFFKKSLVSFLLSRLLDDYIQNKCLIDYVKLLEGDPLECSHLLLVLISLRYQVLSVFSDSFEFSHFFFQKVFYILKDTVYEKVAKLIQK